MLIQYLAKSASIERNIFFENGSEFLVPNFLTFLRKCSKNQEKRAKIWEKSGKKGKNLGKRAKYAKNVPFLAKNQTFFEIGSELVPF